MIRVCCCLSLVGVDVGRDGNARDHPAFKGWVGSLAYLRGTAGLVLGIR